MTFNLNPLESLIAVVQERLESEVTQFTYGVTKVIKHGMDSANAVMADAPDVTSQVTSPMEQNRSDELEQQVNQRLVSVEQTLEKISNLVDQMAHRGQSLAQLETRMMELEESRHSSEPSMPENAVDSAAQISALESRIAALEDSISSVSLLAGEIGDRSEMMISLNNRLTNLERLMQRASVLPKLVDQQGQAIMDLEDRLARLDPSSGMGNPYVSEGDRF